MGLIRKDFKQSFPGVQSAKYAAVTNSVSEEPTFTWWVEDTLRKRHRIINKVESAKYWKWTHKHGIQLLHSSVDEELQINEETAVTDF